MLCADDRNVITRLAVVFALAIVGFAPDGAMAQQSGGGSANFDIRSAQRLRNSLTPSAALTDSTNQISAREAAIRSYLTSHDNKLLNGARVELNSFGLPKTLTHFDGYLTTSESGTAEQIARRFVTRNSSLFQLTALDIRQLSIDSVVRAGTASVVHFVQRVGPYPLSEGSISVAIDSRGRVMRVNTGLLGPAATLQPNDFQLDEEAAVLAAIRLAGVAGDIQFQRDETSLERTRFSSTPAENAAQANVEAFATRIAFPLNASTAVPAYQVITRTGKGGSHESVISAIDGSLLRRHNLTSRLTSGRVYGQSPDSGPPELEDFPEEWLPDGSISTRGPLADVYVDADGDGAPDPGENIDRQLRNGRPFAADGVFDFPFPGPDDDPRDFPAAAANNAFAVVNRAHDYFDEIGFDEASGNLQASNAGPNGIEGDPIIVEVHDGDLVNNATLTFAPDGISPVLELGIFLGEDFSDPTDDRDTAYSGPVIIHEYAHAVSHRLVRAPLSTSCLAGTHSGALGEGWSDYFAASFYDDPVFGVYVSGNSQIGIRRSALNASAAGYADLGNEGFEEHNDGEIWSATLWDIRSELGQEITDSLVIAGMKLTPCDPTMVDARDAILDADRASNGGSNVTSLWEVFARHGLGSSATGFDGGFLIPTMFTSASDTPPRASDNHLPLIMSRPLEFTLRNESWGYRILAIDSDQDPLAFTLIEGPDGLTLNPTTGRMGWNASSFTTERIVSRVSDGTGEVIHGVTIPIATILELDRPQPISAPRFAEGLVAFFVPENTRIVQLTLRGGTGNLDAALFGPSDFVISERSGTDETLTVGSPGPGVWIGFVDARSASDNVSIRYSFPTARAFAPNTSFPDISRPTSSESYFVVDVPEGAESLNVSTGGGTDDVDLYLGFDRIPVCQESRFVDMLCDFDESDVGPSNFHAINVNGAGLSAEKATRIEAPAAGKWFINLSASREFEDLTLNVVVETGQGAPRIAAGGVVNGASFFPGVAPGAIASLFGGGLVPTDERATTIPLPKEMQGIKVVVDDVTAPLYFGSAGQINFQIPMETAIGEPVFGLPGLRQALVTVDSSGKPSGIAPAFILADAPAIFTYTSAGAVLEPVIVHADGSLVTPESPATPGEIVVVFFTGLGSVTNPPATGEAASASPISVANAPVAVRVGPNLANVLFTGLTAGFVGLAQLNIQLPDVLPTGGRATIQIRIGGVFSRQIEMAVSAGP